MGYPIYFNRKWNLSRKVIELGNSKNCLN